MHWLIKVLMLADRDITLKILWFLSEVLGMKLSSMCYLNLG